MDSRARASAQYRAANNQTEEQAIRLDYCKGYSCILTVLRAASCALLFKEFPVDTSSGAVPGRPYG